MMDNIFIRQEPAGNIKPDKEKSMGKINGAVATVMALDRALRNEMVNGGSMYDKKNERLLQFEEKSKMTNIKRKGARSKKDIPENILEQLNRGEIESANLVEWLAIDRRILLENVLIQLLRKVRCLDKQKPAIILLASNFPILYRSADGNAHM